MNTHLRALSLLSLALAGGLLLACSSSHAPTTAGPASPLESCLERGGELRELAVVDNNDVADHGALITLAVSEGSRIAAAGADGTIKFWDLEAGLLGTASTAELLYGSELGGAEVGDMVFLGDSVLAGDRRGVVTQWELEATFRVVGGTDPDIAIIAVAADGAGRIAHADEQEGGHVMVRSLEGGVTFGPLETELSTVRDLLFLEDGRLLLAGATAEGAAWVEIRDALDPERTEASLPLAQSGPVLELARAGEGDLVAAIGEGFVELLHPSPAPVASLALRAHGPRSVALSEHARLLFTVGADGRLLAHSTLGGELRQLASFAIADPVTVRAAADGEHLFVGSREGHIHLLGCGE